MVAAGIGEQDLRAVVHVAVRGAQTVHGGAGRPDKAQSRGPWFFAAG
jgi:hypothetical protein